MTDLTPNDLSHLSDAEFHALCPQGEHAPGPEPLSPAAQAILAAFDNRYELLGPLESNWQEVCLAAALRALADAVVPADQSVDRLGKPFLTPGDILWDDQTASIIRRDIYFIATELENHEH